MRSLECGGLAFGGERRCHHEVIEIVADVPLCLLHRSRITKEILGDPHPKALVLSEPPAEQIREGTFAVVRVVKLVDHVVYYLGDPDSQLVKIGTASQLVARISTLRVHRPRVTLLATEPGSVLEERDRHIQFKALRTYLRSGEREWFRKAPALMQHIGDLRLQHGILSSGRRSMPAHWIAPLAEGHKEPRVRHARTASR